jgi:hypothetical protein
VNLFQGLAVEIENGIIIPAYDQESGSLDARERVAGKIGTPAAGDHCADQLRVRRGGAEGCGGPGAGAEQPDLESGCASVDGEPLGRAGQAVGKQVNIEAKMARAQIDLLFIGREQVQQQRTQCAVVQDLGHVAVARAMATAAAAMGEQYDAARVLGQGEIAFQDDVVRVDGDGALCGPRKTGCVHGFTSPYVALHGRREGGGFPHPWSG